METKLAGSVVGSPWDPNPSRFQRETGPILPNSRSGVTVRKTKPIPRIRRRPSDRAWTPLASIAVLLTLASCAGLGLRVTLLPAKSHGRITSLAVYPFLAPKPLTSAGSFILTQRAIAAVDRQRRFHVLGPEEFTVHRVKSPNPTLSTDLVTRLGRLGLDPRRCAVLIVKGWRGSARHVSQMSGRQTGPYAHHTVSSWTFRVTGEVRQLVPSRSLILVTGAVEVDPGRSLEGYDVDPQVTRLVTGVAERAVSELAGRVKGEPLPAVPVPRVAEGLHGMVRFSIDHRPSLAATVAKDSALRREVTLMQHFQRLLPGIAYSTLGRIHRAKEGLYLLADWKVPGTIGIARRGEVLVAANGVPLRSLRQFRRIVSSAGKRKRVTLRLWRPPGRFREIKAVLLP